MNERRDIAYHPPRWLRNGHANTLYSYLLPRLVRLPAGEDALLEVAPEVNLLLRCNWQPQPAPVVILVHGLEGSSEVGYMRTTGWKTWRRGWHVVRMNVRSCGDSENHCASLYNSGLSGDLGKVLDWALARPQVTEAALVGFSMGGNTLLKLLGEMVEGAPRRLRAAAAVSASLDLSPSSDALHRRANTLYERRFLRSLDQRVRRAARRLPGLRLPVESLARVRSMRDFDDCIVAPIFGYRDAEDYYFRASAARVIDRIRVPCLILHAEDDPFIVITPESRALIAANPALQFVATAHGGHCAFMNPSSNGEDWYWAENRALDFLGEHMQAR